MGVLVVGFIAGWLDLMYNYIEQVPCHIIVSLYLSVIILLCRWR